MVGLILKMYKMKRFRNEMQNGSVWFFEIKIHNVERKELERTDLWYLISIRNAKVDTFGQGQFDHMLFQFASYVFREAPANMYFRYVGFTRW